MQTQKIKDYIIIFLVIMTIVFTIQTFTTSLEIKELENGQLTIQDRQDFNRNSLINLIINSTDRCLAALQQQDNNNNDDISSNRTA